MMSGEKSNKFLDEISLLADKAASFGIGLSSSELGLFQAYLEELWEWNRRFNLTGLKTRERIVIELFLDSLILAPFLPEKASMLDVGSGAGFPGLPLKIRHPGLQTHLLESSAKKVSFLKQVIRTLRLQGVDVIQGRIEAHKAWLYGEGYGVITARALANLNKILHWCSPILSEGGVLVAFLGAEGEKDVEKSKEALDSQGLWVKQKVSYTLPGKKTKRHAFIFKKEGLG
jgi:16S rRNA (guanine527-N7)-methyltransferase